MFPSCSWHRSSYNIHIHKYMFKTYSCSVQCAIQWPLAMCGYWALDTGRVQIEMFCEVKQTLDVKKAIWKLSISYLNNFLLITWCWSGISYIGWKLLYLLKFYLFIFNINSKLSMWFKCVIVLELHFYWKVLVSNLLIT